MASDEFGKCYVNFTRATKNAERTIAEVTKEYNDKMDAKERAEKAVEMDLFEGKEAENGY